jgi:hypothetical protein
VLYSEYHGVGPHTSTGESKYVDRDARAHADWLERLVDSAQLPFLTLQTFVCVVRLEIPVETFSNIFPGACIHSFCATHNL